MKTKKEKFTPGPWRVERHEKKIEIWSANHFVATPEHDLFFSAEKHGLKEANAHLIAAAPEMFEALESICQFYSDNIESCPVALQTFVDLAEQALSKARGE